MNLITFKPEGKIIFVGDTHGDFDATNKVFEKYFKPHTKIVFLGDYVDRGSDSKKNVDYLLKKKKEHPRKIYLLKGNHEAFPLKNFMPADFWMNLTQRQYINYSNKFSELPLALSVGNILALHGALPEINKLEEINQIKDKTSNWNAILWGDFVERGSDRMIYSNSLRPCFKDFYFKKIMKRIGKNILIRSHDPTVNKIIYENKCLTLFTSNAYNNDSKRNIAIADFTNNKEIKTIDDLIIEEI